jgi:signal transduction histidine kinase
VSIQATGLRNGVTRPFGLVRSSGLQLAVGVFCIVVGAEALVAPSTFIASVPFAFVDSGALISLIGLVYLLGGTLLVGATTLAMPHSVRILAALICGALLLILAYPRNAEHAWADSVLLACLAIGSVVGSVAPRGRTSGTRADVIDVLPLVIGAGSLGAGCVLIALPAFLFQDSVAEFWQDRFWYAIALCAGGIALLASVRVDRAGVRLAARLLGAAALVAYGLRVPLGQHAWAGVALYVGFAAALVLLPLGRARLGGAEPSSLRVRLVVTLITVASLPLIVAVTAIANAAEAAALADASVGQEVAARGVSRAASQFDRDYRALVSTVAARGGLGGMSAARQRDVLLGLVATDVFAFSTYSADGRAQARTDEAELVPLAQSLVDEIQRTRSASVAIDYVPGTDRREFVFGAPLGGGDSQVIGYVAASIEANALAPGLQRFGAFQRADARVFLVDGDGRVLVPSDPATMPAPVDLSDEPPVAAALYGGQASGSVRYQTGNAGYVAGYSRVPDRTWIGVVSFPTASVLGGVRAGRELAFGVLLLAAAFSTAIGLFVADRFIRPLNALGMAAEGLTTNDDSTPLPHSSFAEIDQLAKMFGAMRQRLRSRTAERESALEAAREAIRVREVFVSIAAHELKTPLTALRGQTQLLLRVLDRPDALVKANLRISLGRIEAQTRRLARLIEQLLDVARLERGVLALDRQPLQLDKLIAEVLSASPHHERVVANLSGADCTVFADGLRLEQVLMNLLDNAAKFSPDGGPIEVAVTGETDAHVRIAVRDHGLGIPVQHRERIFERFYQAHADSHRSGMGIGLYIAKQVVDMHDGQMRVEFPSDGGTRFVIDLPLITSGVALATAGARG